MKNTIHIFKMKSTLLLSIILFFFIPQIFSQNTCATADPFCTGTTYNFPAGVNAPAGETGPNYSCLGSEPNPVWYYLKILNSGNLEIHMVGGNSTNDIDFICWGPFPDIASICGNLADGGAAGTSHHASGAGGGYPINSVIDCSFNASPEEWCYIPNAIAGEYYMLLITNYSNTACNIIFSQTAGTGTTDCSIMAPPITNNGPLCEGQQLLLTVTNPTAGATYNWTGPGGFTSTLQDPSISNVTTANAGTYSMTITVGGTTSAPVTTTVVINTNPVANAGVDQSVCAGVSATLTASGGPTYAWSEGSTTASITVTPANTTTYTVTATTNGCTGTDNVVVTVNPNPTATITGTTLASCGSSNGSATVSGGVSYLWSNGQTTATAINLAAGSYPVTVTDANGCTASTTATVTASAATTATATSTNETCGQSNGTVTAVPNGACGTGFTFLWNTLPAQATITATGLAAGSYTVTVTCNGCTTAASATITNLAGPSVSITSMTNATCSMSNASATATASGGTPNYNYQWSCTPAQFSATMSNVLAGTYTVSVTDANGCVATNTTTLTSSPGITSQIIGFINEDCGQSNGSATVSVNGGTAPYTYIWNTNPAQANATATNIPAGTYAVTATDAVGCSSSSNVTITTINFPTVTATSTNEFCDMSDGTATAIPSGGSGNYTYLWSDGQTTATATGLNGNSYSVTINDGFCTASASVFVTAIPGPDAGFSANPQILTIMDGPVSFLDNSSGNIVGWNWTFGDGTATGGVPSIEHSYENLGSFLVTLIVTDNNGCTDTVTDTIKVKEIYTFYIPNTFSPNGDGVNDTWYPQGLSVDSTKFEIKIFDRWGKLVFETDNWYPKTNSAEGWNGTFKNEGDVNKVLMDVYVYRIRTKEISGAKHEYIGRVSLIP
jgi:gliding motility-associated-like protein